MEHRNTLALNTYLRQYLINKVIGQGGFGITYRALDTELHRQVAIKECYPRDFVLRNGATVVSASPDTKADYDWAIEKFVQEATTLARFRHPGIVQVLQIIKGENNTAYMVLEYVDGQTLEEWLKSTQTAPTEERIISLVRNILDALDVIHKENVVHLDIAPDNIKMRENGEAVLLDFGAARLTTGQHSKTLNLLIKDGYSAIEQYYEEGRRGPWTDIYAFAATLYRCISGKRPVAAMARFDAINNNEPDPLPILEVQGYSPSFLQAVMAGLAPNAKNRPRSVAEWRAMFDTVSSQAQQPTADPVQQTTSHITEQQQKSYGKGRRRRTTVMIGGCLIALPMVAGIGAWMNGLIRVAAEEKAWNDAVALDVETAYRDFRLQYPDSQHDEEVERALTLLTKSWRTELGDGRIGEPYGVASFGDGLLVAGYLDSDTHLKRQAAVFRLSRGGRVLWQSEFGQADLEVFRAVTALDDDGLVVAGDVVPDGGGAPDGLVVRYTASGEVTWSRRFGGPGRDQLLSIRQLSSGNLVAVGTKMKNADSTPLGWVLTLTPRGEMIEEKTFDPPGGGTFTAIAETAGGGLVLAGQQSPQGDGEADFWIVRLDREGNEVFNRKSGGQGRDQINAATTGSDGEIILAGETGSFGADTQSAILLRLTADNKIPPKGLPHQGSKRALLAITDGTDASVVAVGSSASGSAPARGWLVKLSSDLRVVKHEKTLGEGPLTGVAMLKDGTFAVVGRSSAGTDTPPRIRVERLTEADLGEPGL